MIRRLFINHRAGGPVLVVCCCLSLLACGKKALPTPRDLWPAPVVTQLKAFVDADRVYLTWQVEEPRQAARDRLTGFRIYRREASGPSDCETCPPRFVLAAEADARKRASGFGYEEPLEKTRVPEYRVSCVMESGREGEMSAPVRAEQREGGNWR